ncbi:MAG: DNA double-strand break repair nuclease NurA [Promethearchaeota archaeon]
MTLANRPGEVTLTPGKSGFSGKARVDPSTLYEIALQRHAEAFKQIRDAKSRLVAELRARMDKLNFSSLRSRGLEELLEDPLTVPIDPVSILGLKVASVDGGLQTRVFSNFQFVLTRAIGGVFRFRNSGAPAVKYYPDESRNFRVEVIHRPMSSRGFEFNASIERALMEVELVNHVLKADPELDLVILDGSILAEPLDVFFKGDGNLLSRYNKLLREYYKLYKSCLENNVLVAGCVKDSRSSRLTAILRDSLPMLIGEDPSLKPLLKYDFRDILGYFRDEELFGLLLDWKERTPVFQYSSDTYDVTGEIRRNSLLSRLPINFYAFYGKMAELDAPLRVEFFAREDPGEVRQRADLLAATLFPLASNHRMYAVPVPQIEVHRRAKITPQEMELQLGRFLRKLDPQDVLRLMAPRRNRRPFK